MHYSLSSIIYGAITMFVGISIRFFSQGYTGDWTRGSRIGGEYLIDIGMFSIVRNPLYIGNFFIGLGFTLISNFHLLILVPIYTVIFVIYYYPIVKSEERYLENKFGTEFTNYVKKVPSIFPKFKLWKSGNFSARHALKMERSTHLTIIAIFIIFLLRGLLWKPF